jgi:hypothetical protein
MKKIAILAGVLMVITAGAALAQSGINVAWTDCLGGGGTGDKTITCTNSATASNLLFVSFISPNAIPNVGAVDGLVDVQTTNTIGTWWNPPTTSTRWAGNIGPSTCPGWFDAAPDPALIFGPTLFVINSNRIRLSNTIIVAAGEEQPVDAGVTEYLSHVVQLKFSSGTLNNAECVGGAALACVSLNVQAPGVPNTFIQNPSTSQCGTWRGGGGQTCPAATPTKKASWGSIKALYR